MTERKEFKEAAEKTLRLFADRLHRVPQAVPYLLLGTGLLAGRSPGAVVLAGDTSAARWRLYQAAHAVYQPHKVILGTAGPVEPFAKTLAPKDNRADGLCLHRHGLPAADPRPRDRQAAAEITRALAKSGLPDLVAALIETFVERAVVR